MVGTALLMSTIFPLRGSQRGKDVSFSAFLQLHQLKSDIRRLCVFIAYRTNHKYLHLIHCHCFRIFPYLHIKHFFGYYVTFPSLHPSLPPSVPPFSLSLSLSFTIQGLMIMQGDLKLTIAKASLELPPLLLKFWDYWHVLAFSYLYKVTQCLSVRD